MATRDGFQRKHAHATPAATSMPVPISKNGFRPRW